MNKFWSLLLPVPKPQFTCLVFRNNYSKSFVPFYDNFFRFSDNTAVIDKHGAYKYQDILYSSVNLAQKIRSLTPNSKVKGERISFLCPNDATYLSCLLACWITGNVAVPLCSSHPQSLLEYYVEDSQSKFLITTSKFQETVQNISSKVKVPFFKINHEIFAHSQSKDNVKDSDLFSWDSEFQDRNALIIYTSGTTGKPKGVVLNHGTLYSQVTAVVEAWEISSKDSILHSLPLHHIHGIMNALLCILKAGGTVVMQEKFDAVEAWEHFLNLKNKPTVNLFFAVPTMYAKLVQEFEKLSIAENTAKEICLEKMRLTCSGSASLPIPVFHRWEEITGHCLVERFGMSEIGMALSNQVHGPRIPGAVGIPLPAVEIKIRKSSAEPDQYTDVVYGNDKEIKVLTEEGDSGELLVRGPNVFKEYWNKEKATTEAFTDDGWFLTGDTACFEKGAFRILGRSSVDIIKSGGYKISALEVESCLLRHPDIVECTVFGLPDSVWGERVSALILFKNGKSIDDVELKSWCKQYIAPYAVPTVIKHVDSIPRNVLGKVNKKELRLKYST